MNLEDLLQSRAWRHTGGTEVSPRGLETRPNVSWPPRTILYFLHVIDLIYSAEYLISIQSSLIRM